MMSGVLTLKNQLCSLHRSNNSPCEGSSRSSNHEISDEMALPLLFVELHSLKLMAGSLALMSRMIQNKEEMMALGFIEDGCLWIPEKKQFIIQGPADTLLEGKTFLFEMRI